MAGASDRYLAGEHGSHWDVKGVKDDSSGVKAFILSRASRVPTLASHLFVGKRAWSRICKPVDEEHNMKSLLLDEGYCGLTATRSSHDPNSMSKE